MTKVYLIRHGVTDYNKKGCYYGWTDCGLAEEGIAQAEALRKVFENIQYDVILSSDLKRAAQTANIMNCCSQKLVVDSRLRELNFGLWEGKTCKEIMTDYAEHWNRWVEDWKSAAPTEGESFENMYSRICDFMDEVLDSYKDKTIVIVSHNGSLRIIAAYLLGLPMDKVWCFSFEHGRYSLLELYDGHCSIKCINNDERR